MEYLNEDIQFIKNVKYGFVAVDEDDNVIHFCGFTEEPGKEEQDYFEEDLNVQIKKGVFESYFEIREATTEEIEAFKEVSLAEVKVNIN